ncbi:hypothetical protein VPH35_123682 [Triticum aestivum]
MMEKLSKVSSWRLAVRSELYCRCFCINDNQQADWPPLLTVPGLAGDNGATRIRCREEDPDPYDGRWKVTHFFGSLRLAPLTASRRCICWVTLGVLNKNWHSAPAI